MIDPAPKSLSGIVGEKELREITAQSNRTSDACGDGWLNEVMQQSEREREQNADYLADLRAWRNS